MPYRRGIGPGRTLARQQSRHRVRASRNVRILTRPTEPLIVRHVGGCRECSRASAWRAHAATPIRACGAALQRLIDPKRAGKYRIVGLDPDSSSRRPPPSSEDDALAPQTADSAAVTDQFRRLVRCLWAFANASRAASGGIGHPGSASNGARRSVTTSHAIETGMTTLGTCLRARTKCRQAIRRLQISAPARTRRPSCIAMRKATG